MAAQTEGIARPVTATKVGIDGVVRTVQKTYVGVGSTVRTVDKSYIGLESPVLELQAVFTDCCYYTGTTASENGAATVCRDAETAAQYGSYTISSNEKTFTVRTTYAGKGLNFSGTVKALCGDGTLKNFTAVAGIKTMSITVSLSNSGSGSSWRGWWGGSFFDEYALWQVGTKTFTEMPEDSYVHISTAMAYGSSYTTTMTLGKAIINGYEVPIKFVFDVF